MAESSGHEFGEVVPIDTHGAVGLTSTAALEASLAERKKTHEARASRFGTAVMEPRDISVLGSRRAGSRRGGGFATGFDVLAPEQADKRAARAARFASQLSPDLALSSARGVVVSAQHQDGPLFGGNALETAGPLGTNGPVASSQAPVLASVNPLENRRDVALGEVPRPCVVHIFGVDNMSTDDVMSHFREYGCSWVEWINDSSLNVTFEDAHTASRVLTFMLPSADAGSSAGEAESARGVGVCEESIPDAPPDRMSDAENAGASARVAAEGTTELLPEFVWRKLQPFKKRNSLIPLWMRLASKHDVRPSRPNPKSKWARSVVGLRSRKGERPLNGPRRKGDKVNGDGDEDMLRSITKRRLRVRGGIAKARAKKPSLMDVDKALESK